MAIQMTPNDGFSTLTSIQQRETEAVLLEHRPNSDGASTGNPSPTLNKQAHLGFLLRNLRQGLPARYISQDASQPWLLYWTIHAFSLLQIGLDPDNKQRIIDKILRCQHETGGFGGGQGQGDPDQMEDGTRLTGLYDFFMSLKQPDGSFTVSRHMEVDVRGIYCLLVSATLLNILTPELVEGTASFLASCQTFEGGFASSSQPYFDPSGKLLRFPRPPLGEAHGGYTFCATAGWVLCQPFMTSIQNLEDIPSINTSSLLRWLTNMQGGASELGGFRGRTNKLVDGCYSWWCGGAFNLLEALGVEAVPRLDSDNSDPSTEDAKQGDSAEQWEDIPDSLYDREALQEYVLYAGQHPAGGLRDKPPKNPDSYHTLYCLAGLASAQHRVVPSPSLKADILKTWKPTTETDSRWNGVTDDLRRDVFASSLSWAEDLAGTTIVGGAANRVNATHPVFNLTMTHSEAIMNHFYHQSFSRK